MNCEFLKGYDRDAEIEWGTYGEFEELQADEDGDLSNSKLHAINISDSRIKIKKVDSSSTLVIQNVDNNDRMFYVCRSRNPVGTFNNTILLRVRGKNLEHWNT